jgi:hypothetical protein
MIWEILKEHYEKRYQDDGVGDSSNSGTCMIVEPFAQNELENNVNSVASTFYAASTLICVPNSLAFNGPALGAQAGENRIKDVAMKSGFSHFKRVLETPVIFISIHTAYSQHNTIIAHSN